MNDKLVSGCSREAPTNSISKTIETIELRDLRKNIETFVREEMSTKPFLCWFARMFKDNVFAQKPNSRVLLLDFFITTKKYEAALDLMPPEQAEYAGSEVNDNGFYLLSRILPGKIYQEFMACFEGKS